MYLIDPDQFIYRKELKRRTEIQSTSVGQ